MNKEGRKRGRSDRCDVLWPKTRLGCRGSCWGGRSFPLVGSALGVWGVNPALCPLPSLVTVHTPLPGRSSFFRASLKSLMAFCGSFLPPPQRLCFLFSPGKEKLAPSPPTAVVLYPHLMTRVACHHSLANHDTPSPQPLEEGA